MANDNSGVSAIEFATRDDQGEEYSEYYFEYVIRNHISSFSSY